MLVPIVVGIVCIPFAVKGLGDDGFGILSIAWIILGYLTLLDFGLAKATMKFVAERPDPWQDGDIPQLIWTAVTIAFITGMAAAGIITLVAPHLVNSILKIEPKYIIEAEKAFFYVALSLPFMLASTSLKGVLGALQRFDLVNVVQVPVSIISIVIPALSFPFGWSVSTVVLLIVITRASASFGYLLLCINQLPFLIEKFSISTAVLRKLLSYGGWITITGIISPVLVYLDRFLIGTLISMSAVTMYAAPFEAVNRLRIFPIALMRTFFPEFSALSSRGNRAEVEKLAVRSIKYILLPVGIVALILFVFAPDILELWLGTRFANEATIILRIFSGGILVSSIAYVPFNLLQSVGRPDLPAKFHLFEFPIYLIFLWYLTGEFQIIGAAAAWCIRVILDLLLQFIWAVKLFPGILNDLKNRKVLHEGGLLFFFGLLLYILRIEVHEILPAVAGGLVLIGCLSIAVWKLILDQNERKIVISIFHMKKTVKTRV
jgi:O-antigen/teichoic acid export membrane protein